MKNDQIIIHPTSIVVDGAIINSGVYIGPFCYIGPMAKIGKGSILKSHIVIDGISNIGNYNTIYQFVTIGGHNQDLKYNNESTCVEIGNNNQIRESVTIHRGTIQAKGITKIGDNNIFMVNTHVAHDCLIGNNCVFANNATLGGHVIVDDFAIIGGMTAIHQFCVIGSHSLIGGCSGVSQDVPPYIIAHGNHATQFGINYIGLKRRGFSKKSITVIQYAYKLLYKHNKSFKDAKLEINNLSSKYKELQPFYRFFSKSTRGVIR